MRNEGKLEGSLECRGVKYSPLLATSPALIDIVKISSGGIDMIKAFLLTSSKGVLFESSYLERHGLGGGKTSDTARRCRYYDCRS